jgi:hypothetical protein
MLALLSDMTDREPSSDIRRRRGCSVCLAVYRPAGFLLAILGLTIVDARAFGQGQLDAIRQDVRTADPPAASAPSAPGSRSTSEENHCSTDPASMDEYGNLFLVTAYFGAMAVTSPIWAPHAMLDDDFSVSRSFARFPYDDVSGYTTISDVPNPRLWSAQFSTDYSTTFDDLDRVGGRLVVNTSSRLGFDAAAGYFQEGLPNRPNDHLWLGNGNITFCFAQDDSMMWRTGLGMNWLNDSKQTDVGFNFTYGFDWFPRRPWVISTVIDVGNLGRSGYFHFRGTLGAIFNRFETYAGYEHYNFDRVQLNLLIAGVRVWF